MCYLPHKELMFFMNFSPPKIFPPRQRSFTSPIFVSQQLNCHLLPHLFRKISQIFFSEAESNNSLSMAMFQSPFCFKRECTIPCLSLAFSNFGTCLKSGRLGTQGSSQKLMLEPFPTLKQRLLLMVIRVFRMVGQTLE